MKRSFNVYTRTNQVIIDGSIFGLSFLAAYLIRFDGALDGSIASQMLLWLPLLIAARLLAHWRLGVYRFLWRFVSLPDVLVIARSLLAVTSILLLLRFAYPGSTGFSAWVHLPLSVIALEFLLSLTGSLGARMLRRIQYERNRKKGLRPGQKVKRVILYGAGRAGVLLLRELRTRAEAEVIGFIDDDPSKIGTMVAGIDVLCGGDAMGKLVRQVRADEVIISMATATRHTLMQILARCKQVPVPAKIIPSLREIIDGRLEISRVRDVQIEDLLGRDAIRAAEFSPEVRQAYEGKRILVTGAGGSIGSELVRQLLLFNPSMVGILDKDENSTYELEQEVKFRDPKAPIYPYIADIRHRQRLQAIFADLKPQVVFHAAAHKHVPLMELHPCEAVLNNALGTNTLLQTSSEKGVERFIFISTDKAVNPTNVMGATKRVGEVLVQISTNGAPMKSACVRFGNVMGSRGSVIPLFQKQIAEGGPITVTHPDVVRFFMTISEAVQLVLRAGTLANHGEVYVLDMGSPRKILDLANEMVILSGLQPGKDIEISITGLRPGEKLREELTCASEHIRSTKFEKLSLVIPEILDQEAFLRGFSLLAKAAQQNDPETIYETLSKMGFGFRSQIQPREAFPRRSSVNSSRPLSRPMPATLPQ